MKRIILRGCRGQKDSMICECTKKLYGWNVQKEEKQIIYLCVRTYIQWDGGLL